MLNFEIEKDFLKDFADDSGLIAGIDEAGRGALAGPVVASSIMILNYNLAKNIIENINDSKKMTIKRREEIYELLKKSPAIIGVGIIDNNFIDKVNILNATFLAMEKSLINLSLPAKYAIIDGNKIPKNIKIPAKAIVKGDGKSLSIGAASIIAKVTRDKIMDELAKEYPEYGWNVNKGYGTKHHYEMIEKYGITKYHRKSFRLGPKSDLLDSQSQPLFPNLSL